MPVLANVVAFQIGWFACVLGAAHHLPLLGTGIAAGILVLHLALAHDAAAEAKLVLTALGIGLIFDPVLVLTGMFNFTSGAYLQGSVAPWMLALWMLFAMTLNLSLRWLKPRPLLALALGGAGGPLAYLAGEKLGALVIHSDLAIAVIGAGWAFAMWLLVMLARRFDGFAAPVVVSGGA
jgi:hypothetical protein